MGMNRLDTLLQVLDDHFGEEQWRYDVDLPSHRIAFTGNGREPITGHCDVIASVAARPATLLWGWSPQVAEFVGPDPLAAQLRAFGEQNGLQQFVAEEVPYEFQGDQGDAIIGIARDAGFSAVEVLGAETMPFLFPLGGGSQGVLRVAGLSVPLPPVTVTEVGIRLPRFVGLLDDLAWSLDGLTRLNPAWTLTVTDDRRTFTLADPAAQQHFTATADYDDLNRLSGLKMRLGG